MIYKFGIIVLNSHIGCPIYWVINILIIFGQILLKSNLLLPSVLEKLILYITLNIKCPVFNLLMDMSISIMTYHVYIQALVRVLVSKTWFCEILFVLWLGIVEPIWHAVVYRNTITLSQMKEKMRLIHSKIVDFVLEIGTRPQHQNEKGEEY